MKVPTREFWTVLIIVAFMVFVVVLVLLVLAQSCEATWAAGEVCETW